MKNHVRQSGPEGDKGGSLSCAVSLPRDYSGYARGLGVMWPGIASAVASEAA